MAFSIFPAVEEPLRNASEVKPLSTLSIAVVLFPFCLLVTFVLGLGFGLGEAFFAGLVFGLGVLVVLVVLGAALGTALGAAFLVGVFFTVGFLMLLFGFGAALGLRATFFALGIFCDHGRFGVDQPFSPSQHTHHYTSVFHP